MWCDVSNNTPSHVSKCEYSIGNAQVFVFSPLDASTITHVGSCFCGNTK